MVVCGKCKVSMRSGSSLTSIRMTRAAYAKTIVCQSCFNSAPEWKKRNITSEDVALEQVKKELKRLAHGRTMVRQNHTNRGDELNGINSWDVYFDDPNDKDRIGKVIGFGGFTAGGFRIIGGAYGYVRSFRTRKVEQS